MIVCNNNQWQVRFTIYRLSRPTCGVLFVALVLENSTAYNIIWSSVKFYWLHYHNTIWHALMIWQYLVCVLYDVDILYMFWYQIALISMSCDTLIYRVSMKNGILFGGYLIWIWMIWKPFSLISRLLKNSRQDLIRSCSNCRADQSILPLPLHQVFNECCRHRSYAEIYYLAC